MTKAPRRRRPPTSPAFFLLTMLACTVPRQARADAPLGPRVGVELRGCDEAFADEVRRIAGVELHASVVAAQRAIVTEVLVTCREGLADLWVSDAATAKVSLRTVSLAQTSPRARARLIALAVAELVSASWEEVETNPEPKVPAADVVSPEVRAEVRRAVREVRAPSRVSLDALGSARVFTGGSLLFGGLVRSSFLVGSWLTLRLEAGTAAGSQARTLGSVGVQATHGALAVGGTLDMVSVEVVPWIGVAAGYARIAGEPGNNATGLVQSGIFAGPEAGVDVRLWPRALVHLSLGIAGGGALRSVRGDVEGDSGVGVSGAWGTLSLGVGISAH
jgi:hypothetical protein